MHTLFRFIVSGLLLGGILTACDSNPVDDDHDHHAEEVEGLRLVAGQLTMVTYDGATEDTIFVAIGAETELITVEFLDGDGDEVHADELSDEFSLGYDFGDVDVAAFEQDDEDGRWRFRLRGLQSGSTTMDLHLMHLDHEDFTAFDLPVVVTEVE